MRSDFEFRELSIEEMNQVSGGNFGFDAAACIGAAVSAMSAPSIGTGIGAAVSCTNAVNGIAPDDGSVANCVGQNACVDGSGDSSDGNGSVGDGSGGGDSGSCGVGSCSD